MKVCIPTEGNKGLDELVGEHFGMAPYFTVVDTETDEVKALTNTSEHKGGRGYPPEIMAKAGVDVMLCGGLGGRAIMMFEQMGIMVYVGAHGKVRDAIEMWNNNKLQVATDKNACKQHGSGHDHCDGHHH